MKNEPIKMTPAFRYASMTPWGGNRLREWGKEIPDECTGESLEISVLPGLESCDQQGKTLSELLKEGGEAMRGSRVTEEFPLLLKLINAESMLSVQVHPDDEYAKKYENGKLGKTEAWVILDACPNAEIVYGISEGITQDMLAQACKNGGDEVRKCLRKVHVKAGEVYYIPAGMVHALGGGITLMEIQQSSDVTYRFYDWDRVDKNGKGRELHIQKGLDVTNTEYRLSACAGEQIKYASGSRIRYICENAFTLERWQIKDSMLLSETPEHFILLCSLGEGLIKYGEKELSISRGDCLFIPARHSDWTIFGALDMLVCWPGKA